MKKIDIVEEALQEIRDVFEDIVVLKETIEDEYTQKDAWYDWALEYLIDNLHVSKDIAQNYLEKLLKDGNTKKKHK